MPLNTNPIYSGVGDIQWASAPLVNANPSFDATGTGSVVVFTASVSGSFVQRIRFKASGSTTATAARIFIGNATVGTLSGSNVVLFDEITLPAVTVNSAAAQPVFEVPVNAALPANYKIQATVALQQTAGGGWFVSAVGGSYTTP
jgi:Tfp pilus assembly protein FimT